MRFGVLVGVLIAACTASSAPLDAVEGTSPLELEGTYVVTSTLTELDVACASVPTTPVAGICSTITIAKVPDAVFDHISGCSFFNLDDASVYRGSDGWFAEAMVGTCTQNCGDDALPLSPEAIMTFVDDRSDIRLAATELVLTHKRRTAELEAGTMTMADLTDVMNDSHCAEVDLISAGRLTSAPGN
jgi:hypothetical protein